ncbi:hypothetical protein ACP70R_020642 [Stipagrostis hirtigluma subsp. patula]
MIEDGRPGVLKLRKGAMAMPWELAQYIIAVTWLSLAGWITACIALADGVAGVLHRRNGGGPARRRRLPVPSTVVLPSSS